MLLPIDMIGRSCCTTKNGAPDVDCKRPVEILDRGFFDGRRFRDPRIGDQNVEAISDNAAGLPGKLVSTIRGGKVRGYGIRAATTG